MMTQQEPAAAGTGPLTLEAAIGLLSRNANEAETPAAQARNNEPSEERDENADSQAADRGETEEAAIDAPASWKAEDRDLFRTLPPHLRSRIAAREQERERAVNEALRESAKHRKAAETDRATQEAERLALQRQLDALALGMQQLGGEFPEVRTQGDLVALAQRDPARYAVLRARQDAAQHAQNELKQIQTRMTEQHKAQFESLKQAEKVTLLEKRPELKEPAARERFYRDLKDYAVSVGYTPEQFDSNLLHVNVLVLEKAMLYDRAQRAKAEAQVKTVPRVQQPGTAETRGERAADHRASRLKRLERSGRIEDAIGLLRI